MLVEANEKCRLPGTVDGCSIFEASRDEKKANDCRTEGSIVNEVRRFTFPIVFSYHRPDEIAPDAESC
jgi:hypothetical protein